MYINSCDMLMYLSNPYAVPAMCVAANIMCVHPANERGRYIVTSTLIGWVRTKNDPWCGGDFWFLKWIWSKYTKPYNSARWECGAQLNVLVEIEQSTSIVYFE